MKILTEYFSSGVASIMNASATKYLILFIAITLSQLTAQAQSVIWSDQITQGLEVTPEQCDNWTRFLGELNNNDFLTVKLSGSLNQVGYTITNAAAATELARLLHVGEPGAVTSDGHTWRVGRGCGGSCMPSGVELVVDGIGCTCRDKVVIRAHSGNMNWGGLNGACSPVTQTMKLEFESGASITAMGSTSLCLGEKVLLTANTTKCAGPYFYKWSNGATTKSIEASQAGNYWVEVSNGAGCVGKSATTKVMVSSLTVEAGDSFSFCENPVQLQAVGSSNGPAASPFVTNYCLFDAPSPGGFDNCTFTTDVCADGGVYVKDQRFSQTSTVINPIEIRFKLFYTSCSNLSSFIFKVNGNPIGSMEDTSRPCHCFPVEPGEYVKNFRFEKSKFQEFWNDSEPNELTVEILANDLGINLAGILAEVDSQTEFYSWSPATGLDDPNIANPLATPTVATSYTITYKAGNCTATDVIKVDVKCEGDDVFPIAVCKTLSIPAGENCQGIAVAKDFDNGSTSEDNSELVYSVTPAGPYAMGTTTVTLTVTNGNGLGKSHSCETTITVTDDKPPVIAPIANITVNTTPGLCSAEVQLTAPAATDECGIQSVAHNWPSNVFPSGNTEIIWTATDNNGKTSTTTQTVTVKDIELPTIQKPLDIVVASNAASCSATVILDKPVAKDNCGVTTVSKDWQGDLFPEGVTTVTWTATDVSGNIAITTQTVTVNNLAPVIHSISPSAPVVAVNSSVSLTTLFTDTNVNRASIDWKDGSGAQIIVNPANPLRVTHQYKEAGLYRVAITLTDACGQSTTGVYDHLIVYNVNGGYVTGEGWYNSPRGAYVAMPSATGKASFEFEARYKNGSVPVGETNFQFKTGNLKFRSSDHEWLTIDGHTAIFKGAGKVNGKSGYAILISVVDEDAIKSSKKSKKADRIRVKISGPSGEVVYDTQIGSADEAEALTSIAAGNIKIHVGDDQLNSGFNSLAFDNIMTETSRDGVTDVYPNPFSASLTVQYRSVSRENLHIQLLDMTGKPVYDQHHTYSEDGSYPLEVANDEGKAGLYILKINQGRAVEIMKLLRK